MNKLPLISKGIKEKIDELSGKDNVSGFIIDLRNNPDDFFQKQFQFQTCFLTKVKLFQPEEEIMGKQKGIVLQKGLS